MQQRIDINKLEPNADKAMFGLEAYLSESSLDALTREMIKIRASQINGCAYCIHMHTQEARKQGESEQRIYALSAWRESRHFFERERAILALCDEITLICEKGLSQDNYDQALQALGDNALAQVIVQIATINVWNRLAISTAM